METQIAAQLVSEPVRQAAQLIQIALTPVFMVAGTGIMVTLFDMRLTRVMESLKSVDGRIASMDAEANEDNHNAALVKAKKTASNDMAALLDASTDKQEESIWSYYSVKRLFTYQNRLHKRATLLNIGIIFGAIAAGLTCLSIVALFLGSFRPETEAHELLAFFGFALIFSVLSLTAFLGDTILDWYNLFSNRDSARSIFRKRKNHLLKEKTHHAAMNVEPVKAKPLVATKPVNQTTPVATPLVATKPVVKTATKAKATTAKKAVKTTKVKVKKAKAAKPKVAKKPKAKVAKTKVTKAKVTKKASETPKAN